MSKTALLFITESWFINSHFLPVIRAIKEAGMTPVAATRRGRGADLLEMEGCRIIDVDYFRGLESVNRLLHTIWALRRVIVEERPALIHMISLKPLLLGSLASVFMSTPVVLHLTGLGLIGSERSRVAKLRYHITLGLLARSVSRRSRYLLVENPDDMKVLVRHGARIGDRFAVLGGAGVNPNMYREVAELRAKKNTDDQVKLGFVGRLIWSKGVDVLVAALDELKAGHSIILDIYGEPDLDNPRPLDDLALKASSTQSTVRLHGYVSDIVSVWNNADIAVFPTRGGEGLPRSMLEAAACARPLIVTDVPGCRHFVRNEIEGLVVPPDDPKALAVAIGRLVNDSELRRKMGTAARNRVLDGFTHDRVKEELVSVYGILVNNAGK